MIHIDEYQQDFSRARTRLCDGQLSDPINHPTPYIAATIFAQNPDLEPQYCPECCKILRDKYPDEVVQAKLNAAEIQQRRRSNVRPR
jgi:hypothetical protein